MHAKGHGRGPRQQHSCYDYAKCVHLYSRAIGLARALRIAVVHVTKCPPTNYHGVGILGLCEVAPIFMFFGVLENHGFFRSASLCRMAK